MPVSPARRLAYRVLRRAEIGTEFASDLLRAAPDTLGEADRHLATELVLGVIRRRAQLDDAIERLSARQLSYFDSEVLTILRLGVYQACFLERIPKSAAVNEAVEMTRAARKHSAAGLVNAVLRKCERTTISQDDPRTVRLALPEWLFGRWMRRFSAEAALALARWSVENPKIILRVVEGSTQRAIEELAAAGVAVHETAFAPGALAVESWNVTKSRVWIDGRIVIQEEASQIVGSLLRPGRGQRALDLCAAPGMKSAQVAAELSEGLMILCDRSGRRLRAMHPDRFVPDGLRWAAVQLDASAPLPFGIEFDRILLDAPCSGTGTLARNPEIKWRLTPEDVARLATAQVAMLRNSLSALAPGGRLVYATCSLEVEENEQVVESALQDQAGFMTLSRSRLVDQWPHLGNLFDERGYFHIRPDLHGTDGFFAAVIERRRGQWRVTEERDTFERCRSEEPKATKNPGICFVRQMPGCFASLSMTGRVGVARI
jgi:16S rRNA (cytosine967-C5)-methyltransferase